MPDASTEHSVRTGLGRLHVVDRGRGAETIVLWPSIFTDHHIHDILTELLADRFRFLLMDGPAHGRSGGTPGEVSMQACGAAILSVLDHFGCDRAVVGGTSWGGLAAAEAAFAAPERFTALILMNTPMEIDEARPRLSARMTTWAALLAPQGHFEPVEGKHIPVVETPRTVSGIVDRYLSVGDV